MLYVHHVDGEIKAPVTVGSQGSKPCQGPGLGCSRQPRNKHLICEVGKEAGLTKACIHIHHRLVHRHVNEPTAQTEVRKGEQGFLQHLVTLIQSL